MGYLIIKEHGTDILGTVVHCCAQLGLVAERPIALLWKGSQPNSCVSSNLTRSAMKETMKKQIRLWLDDTRNPVKFGCVGWKWVKTYDEAVRVLRTYNVTDISLDHDLGRNEKTGYDVILWIEHAVVYNNFVPPRMTVHSMNPVGSKNMLKGIEQIKKMSGGG